MGLDSVSKGLEVQPTPTGDGADVTNLVIYDLVERKKVGTQKYGQALKTNNGRNAMIDAYQESLDQTLYLRQRLEEGHDSDLMQTAVTMTHEIEVLLVERMGGDYSIAAAARVSFNNDKKYSTEDNAKLINALMKHRHGTPFEHSCVTFRVHAPIFVWREWHRHRVGFSYNEESGRYKQLDPVFWIPRADRKLFPAVDHTSMNPKPRMGTQEEYDWFVKDSKEAASQAYGRYLRRLDKGYLKEVARACLPVNIYSACYVTCNPRSLMHFLSLRVEDTTATFVSHPQAEIQQAALVCEKVLKVGWPVTYEAFIKNGRVGP